MKAVVVTKYGGPEVLKYTDRDMPVAGSGQVLIRVQAASVNFADIRSRKAKYNDSTSPPFVPGLDAVGIVEQTGPGVTHLQPGQRVIAFPATGSYAEYAVASDKLVFALPDSVDLNTAAACPIVSFTAYKLLADVALLQAGETVLIHAAAGGVGTTAVQMAKILGAGRVIGTVGSERKRAAALEAGADHVICYETEDFVKQVNELTGGYGADVILDSIAGSITEQSLQCLAKYGRLVNYGAASGEGGKFVTTDLYSSCRSVLGFSLGTTRKLRPHLLQHTAEQVLGYFAQGRLNMQIGARFPLAEAAKAHELMESRQTTGKILLHIQA